MIHSFPAAQMARQSTTITPFIQSIQKTLIRAAKPPQGNLSRIYPFFLFPFPRLLKSLSVPRNRGDSHPLASAIPRSAYYVFHLLPLVCTLHPPRRSLKIQKHRSPTVSAGITFLRQAITYPFHPHSASYVQK